nr:immunoglobulin heavy chain junction region [Macaca mulatta]MOV53607.1 immunoglobulin heavy chain junction region [Macaca mulatta]MOV53622.1 immunoglobulin heavy chain junction region [Macaca mulatta]MOV53663.1 immunoglobulin heavy chain junction region [Macaca mulatta]MOV53758.1 immunoglobulin heavy chain junction region [Macaca mulatta]
CTRAPLIQWVQFDYW